VSTDGFPSNGAHFQLFASTAADEVRWRLLSGNNRELGRSVRTYPGSVAAQASIDALVLGLGQVVPVVSRQVNGAWRWVGKLDEEIVVMGPRLFDRRIACVGAFARFVEYAPRARAFGLAVVSTARRRQLATVLDFRERHLT
jgi:hypothetical protein